MNEPVFVVVGHVNRGKSSIVSTLAADDSVRIDATPGTTVHNRSFAMKADDQTLYTLIDTPGFERARHVLAWLKEHETTTADRADVVRRFIETHATSGGGAFPQEVELLRPILDGAAILYVVDGSVPFSPASEAEMEILRWTGQPRMALINAIGDEDHSAQWRPVLDQYFSLVRTFNAHRADFHQRFRMLEALREVNEAWHGPLDRAVEALRADRRRKLHEAAGSIADMLADMLTQVETKKLSGNENPEPHRRPLADRYYDTLRQREQRTRRELRDIYRHYKLEVDEHTADPAIGDDLFRTATWTGLGLSRLQLTGAATAAGAAAGAYIDLHTLGHSFMAGSLIGGALGLGATVFGWDKLAKVKIMGLPVAGNVLKIGPVKNPNFPWVALDRALIFHDLVSQRPHARRDAVTLSSTAETSGGDRVKDLPAPERRKIEGVFTKLRKLPPAEARDALRRDLAAALEDMLKARDDRG